MGQDVKEDEDAEGCKGRRLDAQTINYFKRVEQVLKENAFPDDEQKEAFLKNVFSQVEVEGSQLGRHPATSRILEALIPMITWEQFCSLLKLYEKDLIVLIFDRFGSHVIQTIIKTVHMHSMHENVIKRFCKWCKVISTNCGVLIRNVYGNHIISCCLQCLSGVQVSESMARGRSAKAGREKFGKCLDAKGKDLLLRTVPQRFSDEFEVICKAIENDDNFGEALCHRSASTVLQVWLLILQQKDPSRHAKICQKICQRARIFQEEHVNVVLDTDIDSAMLKLPVVLSDEIGNHVIEVVMKTASSELLDELWSRCLKFFHVPLVMHHHGNYLMQTFLKATTSSEQVIATASKLLSCLEDILAVGHMGVIVALADAAARLHLIEQQRALLSALCDALHIPKKDKEARMNFVRLALCMITYDVFFPTSEAGSEGKSESDSISSRLKSDMLNYHGMCLVKSSFEFAKTKLVVKGFLALEEEEVLALTCNPSGSFCVQSFIESSTVPAKVKAKFASMLAPKLSVLACDKFGSFVVDKLFACVDDSSKNMILAKLREDKRKLEKNMYGRRVLHNCGVSQRVSSFDSAQALAGKKVSLLQEIVGDGEVVRPTKRKSESDEIFSGKMNVEERLAPAGFEPASAVKAQPEKKRQKKDRAARYREELAKLGIPIGPVGLADACEPVAKSPSVAEYDNVDANDLTPILDAIVATTKRKKKER